MRELCGPIGGAWALTHRAANVSHRDCGCRVLQEHAEAISQPWQTPTVEPCCDVAANSPTRWSQARSALLPQPAQRCCREPGGSLPPCEAW
jgi:hypothetical protein